jgi:hypothetical protein
MIPEVGANFKKSVMIYRIQAVVHVAPDAGIVFRK